MFSWFSKPLAVGSEAPPFLLPDEEGSVFVLNLHRNKYVVLVFYPGDDTPICTKQMCEIRDNWARLMARDVMVVGINPQEAQSHAQFRKRHSLPLPLLVDNGKRIARLYNAAGLIVRRTVYVIGKDGKILFSKRGRPSVDEILAAIPSAD
ncbi:MAG: peroxiredoxin [Acidimicrobiia bacterium]|nr:peroxiredoxin [Acidimicrobiia bacterium]